MSQEIKICSNASACLVGGLSAQDTISTDKLSVACGFKVDGGTSNQFLKADGTTDAASYTTCVGTVTPSSVDTFTNKSGSNSQWTNDAGYTTCTGTTTPSNTQTFTNKSGNISQWTNDEGYTTCTGDITQVTAGDALSGGATSGNATIGVDAAAAANWDQSACAGLNCTGTTTASNTQTFTNKSGNISQWTNDEGYTTCTGDINGITLTGGLTGSSLTSGTASIGIDGATAAALDQSALESCPGLDCVGTTTASNTQTFTNKSGSNSQWTNDAGYTTCVGTFNAAQAGLSASGANIGLDAATANSLNQAGCAGLDCVGTVTDIQTAGTTTEIDETSPGVFTVDVNSACDSRWSGTASTVQSNSANWDQSACTGLNCTGDITGVTAGLLLSGGGTSGSVTLGLDSGALAGLDQSACPGILCVGDVTGIDAGTAITVGDGATATPSVGLTTACHTEFKGAYTTAKALSSCAGLDCVGIYTDITAGTGLTEFFSDPAQPTFSIDSACRTPWNGTYSTVQSNSANWDQSSCAGLDCVGTVTSVTAGNTNISIGGTAAAPTVSVNTACFSNCQGTFDTAGAGLSSNGTDQVGLDAATANALNQSACAGLNCVGTVTDIQTATTTIETDETSPGVFTVDVATNCSTAWNGTYSTVQANSASWGGGTGDIEGVTAGAGLSGGGTSGTVELGLLYNAVSGFDQSACLGLNCTGTIDGAGTANFIPYFQDANTLGNSSICQNGSTAVYSRATTTYTNKLSTTGICATDTLNNVQIGANPGTFTGNCNVAIGSGAMCNFTTTGSRNVAIGERAGRDICSGTDNVVMGYLAATSMQGGSHNIALGREALFAGGTSTNYNIALGCQSQQYNTSGQDNVSLGRAALRDNTTGDFNLAIGALSMQQNETGQYNTAVGSQALLGNIGGDNNIALGCDAMYSFTSVPVGQGSSNVALGNSVLRCNQSGNDNIGVGESTLRNNLSGVRNVGLGYSAICSNTTGSYNIGIGNLALCSATGADYNIALGSSALRNTTSGVYNIALGTNALRENTTGSCNTALGSNAMCGSVTGSDNIGIGADVMAVSLSGNGNVTLGSGALNANYGGDYNAAIGHGAGCCNTEGDENVAIGRCANFGNTTGHNNVAIGTQAMFYGLSGAHNFALGQYTLYDNYGGDMNTAIGTAAMQCNTTGSANAALGYRALFNNTTGNDNFAIGECALESNVNGIGNNAQGHYALGGNVTGNYTIGIGNNAGAFFADGCTALSGADDSIYIGRDTRGKDNDDYNSIVIGMSACSCGQNTIKMGNGDITAACVQVAWTAVSDERDKTDITDLDKGLTFIGDLKPKAFKYRENRESNVGVGQCRYGFLAQDILATEGSNNVVVSDSNPDQLGINSDYLVPILVKAVQELEARVKQLESPEATQS